MICTMEKNRTLKTVEETVEEVDVKKFHHENRLLLDELDGVLLRIREIIAANNEREES